MASDRIEDAVSAHGSFLPGLFHQGTAHRERSCPHAATSSAGTWTTTVIFGAAECSADAPQLGAFSHPERDISVLYFYVHHILFFSVLGFWFQHLLRLAR